jgi:ABC-type amino acid transport substrate-binding protein
LLTGTDFPEFGKGQGIALKKGNAELQSKVNEAITSMLKDGTIAAISQKWFAYDISKK